MKLTLSPTLSPAALFVLALLLDNDHIVVNGSIIKPPTILNGLTCQDLFPTKKAGLRANSTTPESCTVIDALWTKADVEKHREETAVGFNLHKLPMRDPQNISNIVGYIDEAATYLGGSKTECVSNGVFLLSDGSGEIFGQGTCDAQKADALTGGTGQYGCAGGVTCPAEFFADGSVLAKFYICGELCPLAPST